MADSSGAGGYVEGFDDFERLDAGNGGEVSAGQQQEEDLYSAPSPSQPLVDLADHPAACASDVTLANQIDPRVLDMIYWRDVKRTGVVFGSMLLLLLSLALFSVLSVLAYLSLAILTVTVSFRIYKNILSAVQKSGDGHPFKQYLEMDVMLPSERAHRLADNLSSHLCCTIRELRRLFLVEDLVDSIKFGLLLWVLTYIGAWFNGMTLVILGLVLVFTLPKVYEVNQRQIDQYLQLARSNVTKCMQQVKDKLPFPGKKQKKN